MPMTIYSIQRKPEILSLGIKALLLSIDKKAHIIIKTDYEQTYEQVSPNVNIHFLFLTSDKNSLTEIKKYSACEPATNKIVVVTQNSDNKYVPVLRSIDFDALATAEEFSATTINDILQFRE
jgi:hypothetical protein